MRSAAWPCRVWLALHTLSPLRICFSAQAWPPVGEAGLASCTRSLAQERAKPELRIPPGYSVVAVLSITDSGAIADRLGGFVAATNSWLIPPYEIPIIPTL